MYALGGFSPILSINLRNISTIKPNIIHILLSVVTHCFIIMISFLIWRRLAGLFRRVIQWDLPLTSQHWAFPMHPKHQIVAANPQVMEVAWIVLSMSSFHLFPSFHFFLSFFLSLFLSLFNSYFLIALGPPHVSNLRHVVCAVSARHHVIYF